MTRARRGAGGADDAYLLMSSLIDISRRHVGQINRNSLMR